MAVERQKKLAFIGPMGSGKSTLAGAYAAKHGLTVFDTDKEFTRRYGEIKAYFAAFGERAFRDKERELVAQAVNSDARIVACGGGAVMCRENMAALRKAGDIVRLSASPDVLRRRIAADGDRPLAAIADGLNVERESAYRRYADYTVDTDCGSDCALAELERALQAPRANRYDVVLCDADDTLLDFQTAMRGAIADTARAVGVKLPARAVVAEYVKILPDVWGRLERGELSRDDLPRERFSLLAERLGVSFDWREFDATYMREIKKTRCLIGGALAFVDGLRERGIKVYIVTNSYKSVASERLKALDGHTDGYFISEDVGADKPDARFFEYVYSAIGKPDKNRLVIFGDGVYPDIHGGKTFGIDTCLFDPSGVKRSEADYTARSYAEFCEIV